MTDYRALTKEWSDHVPDQLKTHTDPLGSKVADLLGLGQGCYIGMGKITDALAHAHIYRVSMFDGQPLTLCTLGMQSTATILGAKSLTTVRPGDRVVVLLSPNLMFGVILCTLPPVSVDSVSGLPDAIHQASACGIKVDGAHTAFAQVAGIGAINLSAERPLDSIPNGDWGAVSERGMKIMMGSGLAQVAADEATGLFVWYKDQLTRLAGINMQIRSASHELDDLIDSAELMRFAGTAVYPWESQGAYDQDTETTRVVDAKASQVDTPYLAPIEPADSLQQGFHRLVQLSGYIGQGGKSFLTAPPEETGLHKYGDDTPLPGLIAIEQTLAGAIGIRAASGIVFSKRGTIVVPRRLKRPEDPTGDTEADYRSSGVGEGPEHKVKAAIDAGEEEPHLRRIAGLFDDHARLFNWEMPHAAAYHEKDWSVPEEEDSPLSGVLQNPLNFAALADEQFLPRPEPTPFKIDHRYQEVDFYPNEAMFGLLDDGSIVSADGYGVSSHSAGGSQFFDAPGDVYIRTGKSIYLMAGKDIVIKAKGSIDLSSTTGDIRAGAFGNIQIAAGLSESSGALLLQSKASASVDFQDNVGEDVSGGGVIIKSAKAPVAFLGSSIYLRTGGADLSGNGQITIDAGQGEGQVNLQAASMRRYLKTVAVDYFGPPGEPITNAHVYGPTAIYLDGHLSVAGRFSGMKSGFFYESISSATGTIATARNGSDFEGLVGTFNDQNFASNLQTDLENDKNKQVADGGKARDTIFEDGWYADNQVGNEDELDAIEFTFRSSEQYVADNFLMFESRWQQLARVTGHGIPWKELTLTGVPQEGSRPFPGLTKHNEECFVTQDLELFDPATGKTTARSEREKYENPEFKAVKKVTLDSGYLVIS